MANKYLKGGALNPVWCMEQDEQKYLEDRKRDLSAVFDVIKDAMDVNISYDEENGLGVSGTFRSSNENNNNINSGGNTYEDYESKFRFLKAHSDSEEDLELAKKIIGISNS